MNKEKNNKIILVIIGLILLMLVAFVGLENINTTTTNNIDNAIENANNTTLYSNLNINNGELNIFYLNVGMADSTFITINNVNMLIDSGNKSDGYYITEFLKAQNISKIDYFIVTHFDADHMGGAYKILENFDIGVLYTPNGYSKTQTYEDFINSIYENNINVDTSLTASKEITYSLGNSNWKVLNINDDNDSNDSSIVIELDYENTKYLFMGDASTNVEDKIEWDKVDVVKIAHHGSDSSTSQKFLNQISPKCAILSVGSSKQYGFPKEEIINRLNDNGIEIYRTDEDGTIWITSDGENINIKKLDYDLDGANKEISMIFERKYYMLSFYFTNLLHDINHHFVIVSQ